MGHEWFEDRLEAARLADKLILNCGGLAPAARLGGFSTYFLKMWSREMSTRPAAISRKNLTRLREAVAESERLVKQGKLRPCAVLPFPVVRPDAGDRGPDDAA